MVEEQRFGAHDFILGSRVVAGSGEGAEAFPSIGGVAEISLL